MDLKEVKEIINEEKALYVPFNYHFNSFIHQKRFMIWKYLSAFRMAQFYKEELQMESANILRKYYGKMMYRYYLRKRNILGEKTNVEIANHSKLGRRTQIWHGGVVVNANLGDDCVIHGNNILGNKGEGNETGIPSLGNKVDIGVGAVIIGGIHIADGCIIGANAVVNKDFPNPGKVIIGIPAREASKN
ncbi:MAG: hypothetical protein E7456_04520 [Ruminococcaceae bacterium]|nr:hypothetical protein [Oscillospiraceae bacterium]